MRPNQTKKRWSTAEPHHVPAGQCTAQLISLTDVEPCTERLGHPPKGTQLVRAGSPTRQLALTSLFLTLPSTWPL